MSPQDPLHSGAVENLSSLLFAKLGSQKSIRIQLPFTAPDNSEPEPDAVILDKEYALDCKRSRVHPARAELIVEVARTSLNYDRLEKSGLYAEAGVGEYWIINLVDMAVEVRREPKADPESPYGWSYSGLELHGPEDVVKFEGVEFQLSEIFLGILDE